MPLKSLQNLVTYSLFLFITLVALYLIKLLDISYPLTISNITRSGELAVVGEGKVDVEPDTAYVDVGIAVSNVESAEKAQNQLSDINNKIIEAMKKLGIEKADIITSNYSVYPNYKYEGSENRISGYNGNASINIKVKKMELTSKIITQATAAGANTINGTRFSIDQPEKYREQARDKAIENAREQAQKLALKLGIRLGKIVNIVESSPSNVVPYMRAVGMEAGGGGGPQIEPGTQTVTSTVTLYFEKK